MKLPASQRYSQFHEHMRADETQKTHLFSFMETQNANTA